MNFVGVDPGVNGGMAVLDYTGRVIDLRRMPMGLQAEDAIWEWAWWLNSLPVDQVVWVEKVSGYIGNVHPGSRMFEFGFMYGAVRMAIRGVKGKLPNEIEPRDWQRYLQIEPRRKQKRSIRRRDLVTSGQKGESSTEWKNRLKEVAQNLFPDVKVTSATADALLIAEYGRRCYGK